MSDFMDKTIAEERANRLEAKIEFLNNNINWEVRRWELFKELYIKYTDMTEQEALEVVDNAIKIYQAHYE